MNFFAFNSFHFTFQDKFNQIFEEDVLSTTSSYTMGDRRNQYFVNKKIKYVWDEATLVFVKLKSIDESMMQVIP